MLLYVVLCLLSADYDQRHAGFSKPCWQRVCKSSSLAHTRLQRSPSSSPGRSRKQTDSPKKDFKCWRLMQMWSEVAVCYPFVSLTGGRCGLYFQATRPASLLVWPAETVSFKVKRSIFLNLRQVVDFSSLLFMRLNESHSLCTQGFKIKTQVMIGVEPSKHHVEKHSKYISTFISNTQIWFFQPNVTICMTFKCLIPIGATDHVTEGTELPFNHFILFGFMDFFTIWIYGFYCTTKYIFLIYIYCIVYLCVQG